MSVTAGSSTSRETGNQKLNMANTVTGTYLFTFGRQSMSLEDELATLRPNPRTFAQWLALKPDNADVIIGYMRDPSIQVEPLLRILRKHNIPCSKKAISDYRDAAE